jgi:hypothetical protein
MMDIKNWQRSILYDLDLGAAECRILLAVADHVEEDSVARITEHALANVVGRPANMVMIAIGKALLSGRLKGKSGAFELAMRDDTKAETNWSPTLTCRSWGR